MRVVRQLAQGLDGGEDEVARFGQQPRPFRVGLLGERLVENRYQRVSVFAARGGVGEARVVRQARYSQRGRARWFARPLIPQTPFHQVYHALGYVRRAVGYAL